jgi:hypothetical protein
VSNGEKYAKSHGIPMFGKGREDTTMKHVVLTALGFVLSFVLAIVWSPFVHMYLSANFSSIGTWYSRHEYMSLWLFLNLLTLCILMAFSIIAGKVCISDAERQKFKLLFRRGSIVGAICLNCGVLCYFFNVRTIGDAGVASVIAVFIGIPIIIGLHLGFTWLFLAIMKGIIQTGINASSEKPDEKESTLWVSVSLAVVCLSIMISLSEPIKLSSPTINPFLADTSEVIAQAATPTVAMYKRWTTQPDSGKHYMYRLQHTKNHCLAEYTKETSRNGEPLCLWRRVYDKNKKLIAEDKYTVPMLKKVLTNIKNLRNRGVAEQIMRYSRKEISQKELVEWAHYVLLDGSVSESSASNIMYAVGRIGLADVSEFGLPENTIEDLIGRLTFSVE